MGSVYHLWVVVEALARVAASVPPRATTPRPDCGGVGRLERRRLRHYSGGRSVPPNRRSSGHFGHALSGFALSQEPDDLQVAAADRSGLLTIALFQFGNAHVLGELDSS